MYAVPTFKGRKETYLVAVYPIVTQEGVKYVRYWQLGLVRGCRVARHPRPAAVPLQSRRRVYRCDFREKVGRPPVRAKDPVNELDAIRELYAKIRGIFDGAIAREENHGKQ